MKKQVLAIEYSFFEFKNARSAYSWMLYMKLLKWAKKLRVISCKSIMDGKHNEK
jgi:hypothetical protein